LSLNASYKTSDSVKPLRGDHKLAFDSGARLRNSKLVRSSCEIVENSPRNDREVRRNSVSKKEIVENTREMGNTRETIIHKNSKNLMQSFLQY